MGKILAIQQYSLREFEGGYGAAFEAVKSMGIDTVEAWCGAVPDDPGAQGSVDDLRPPLENTGMKLTCGHITTDEFDNRYEAWKRLLLDFGSTDWVVPFAQADTIEEWLGYLPKFREMAARLEQDGLSLGYHNHHMELVKLGDKYVMEHLLDNMPELKAQFHIGQFIPSRGIFLPDWIRKYEGRVCSLHVNDSAGDGLVPLGTGTCHAEESVQTALDTGVDIFIYEIAAITTANLDEVKRDLDLARQWISR